MCLPANVEDDGYNLIHTHANDGAFVLAGAPPARLPAWPDAQPANSQ
jgi:hypothetical protein